MNNEPPTRMTDNGIIGGWTTLGNAMIEPTMV